MSLKGNTSPRRPFASSLPAIMNSAQSRRWLPAAILSCLAFTTLVWLYFPTHSGSAAVSAIQRVEPAVKTVISIATVTATATATTTVASKTKLDKPAYTSGDPEPGRQYSKGVVVASTKNENTSWVLDKLPGVEPYIYVVDDPEAKYTVPKNWGNELMPYLTFIIDHYDKLPDVIFFIHAHERTHHNPAIFDHSTAIQIKALNADRVIRMGYMNLNCGTWETGKCTAQIRPWEQEPTEFHKQAFEELFPEFQVPRILAGACCSQFAVSKERILQMPLAKWTRYREWLLDTTEGNPGYIWEYLWQFVLGGEHVFCPASHFCYCDGYNVCFGGHKKFAEYVRLENAKETMLINVRALNDREQEGEALSVYDVDRRRNMGEMIRDLDVEIGKRRDEAFERGKDPELRALEISLD